MSFNILYDNPNENFLTRVLKSRNIHDTPENFLRPTFSNYWIDPYLLNDFEKGIERIITAINNNEKIVIFGDYDADGVTSTYLMYSVFTQFLGYKNISVRLPNRLEDGYGIKTYHIDQIAQMGVSVIITVDNGITAVQEAIHAKNLGIDFIITDHHKNLDIIPDAYAVINPHVSPNYSFKDLCGVSVAFKVGTALIARMTNDSLRKTQFMDFALPIVTIGTIADCMPLVNENRLFVKEGLSRMNTRQGIPPSLHNFLDFVNLKNFIEPYHIGFVIAPRLNASGRMIDPMYSFYTLLYSGDKQLAYLEQLEKLNNERKALQEECYKSIVEGINPNDNVIIKASDEYHEGIIGIAAGKVTEKFKRPSAIFSIHHEKGIATASLRGPEYFSVIDMLNYGGSLCERYGGHKQAGGCTVKIDNLDALCKKLMEYADQHPAPETNHKDIHVDTKLYAHEIHDNIAHELYDLQPFGEGNPEPVVCIDDCTITKVEKIGQRGEGHAKIFIDHPTINFPTLFWGKGGELDSFQLGNNKSIIGKIKRDSYTNGFFIEGEHIHHH